MAETCSVCSREGAQKCSRCKLQFYCSKECQKKDWKSHKKICCEVSKIDAFQKASQPAQGVDAPESIKEFCYQMLDKMSGRGQLVIPEYHSEYRRRYPTENADYQKLRENWMMSKMLDESLMGNLMTDFSRSYGTMDLLKRWQYIGPELTEFLRSNPKPGDIFRNKKVSPYGEYSFADGSTKINVVYQTMRNTPVPSIEFHFGHTYVSIGFVDMFQLLFGSYGKYDDNSDTIIFVGYDKSEVVIARSLILYEMMLQGCSPQSILQVWFSTGWNDKTLKDFQGTCKIFVQEKGPQTEERVKKLVLHWMKTRMTAATVLPLWIKFVGLSLLGPLDNLRFEQDRMDYARYILTGHIFGRNDKDYVHGNVSMFSLPKEFDNYFRQEENFFASIHLNSLPFKGSLLKSITAKITESLTTLLEFVRNGRLVCNFVLKDLNVKDKRTLEEIKKLNAKMIDWSNIPDYLPVNDFLEMATACNGINTTHFLHYINWQGMVFGASLMDYNNKNQIYQALKQEIQQKFNKCKDERPFLRQDKYLNYFMNAADEELCQKYRHKFVDYVFEGRNVTVSEPTSDDFNPFQRSNSCFFVSFSFNSDNDTCYLQ